MIVKFHPRGRGGGSGPVDYLLGKDRQRDGSSVLQGKPEEVRELIDASPYAKKYTSGVLSFAEKDLPPGQREKLIASFERVLMPGLDKDQYSILWVEHADKGRLELNFLIPNTELLTGKRLQPYYDRADRPRIDAWQTVVNGRLGLHDPNAPENRRVLVTPSALPKAKLEAAEAITRGLLALASSGELKTRQGVTEALESAGFEVIRTTKNSISIADPDGGRNIRLKGAIYEQSFNAGEGLRAEIESAAADYRRDAESRIQRARAICKSGTERKREENQRRHARPRPESVLSPAPADERHVAHGQPDVADHRTGIHPADRFECGHSVVAGAADTRQLHEHPGAEGRAGEAECKNVGREFSERQQRTVSGIAERREGGNGLDGGEREAERGETGTGVEQHDRAGNTVAERIRAVTAGLLEKAVRVGERLRGMAEYVRAYATGERGAERAHHELEQAGTTFERAAKPLVMRLDDIEVRREQERAIQQQKALEMERSQRQKTYNGPTLG
ncbi:plasmid mobilization relaxase MbeA [Pectobacterium aroidearum]|uniref:plasmid mobilization relaxase MbeA n=1 Tax=Pectobacterium aroidearum TaxID=1201031 RepID=UPI003D9A0CDE